MTDRPGLDFSFSGLKTFAANTIDDLTPLSEQDVADIACAFEDAVVDTLRIKCQRALEASACTDLVIAGGVSANRKLRATLEQRLDGKVHYPQLSLCTDNGAMIAYAGAYRLARGERSDLKVATRARWPIVDLTA